MCIRDSFRTELAAPQRVAAGADEEVEFLGDALWSCELGAEDTVVGARLIGDLDPAQRSTFDAALKLGTITASELSARSVDQRIGPTAWNNRLSALATKGLLVERKQGKSKSFSPLLEIA